MPTYKIVRLFAEGTRTIKRGLTLTEAQAHCADTETHSPGTSAKARRITRRHGVWFDSYTEDK